MADPRPPILYSSVHLLGRQKFVRKLHTFVLYLYIYISRRKEEYKFDTSCTIYTLLYYIYLNQINSILSVRTETQFIKYRKT